MPTPLLPSSLFVAGALLLGAAAPLSSAPDDDGAASSVSPAPLPPLTRVVTLGASVSAGFGNAAELETEADVPLSMFLQSTLVADGEDAPNVTGGGDRWFFANARKSGEKQVDAALAESPSLVVAVDFLFWYAYGHSNASDPRRAEGLEAGLRQLDRFGCPLVIGDLPDISYALDGKGPFGAPIVTRSHFPTEVERIAMNAAIRAWAERRGDVAIVPLTEMTSNTVEGRPIVVRDRTWTVTDLSDALQQDLLHLKVRGTVWLALMVADAATRLDGVEPGAFVWDEETIRARVWQGTQASRAARAEKERKRRERREKRDRARDKAKKGGQAALSH